MYDRNTPCGFLNTNKSAGCTSRDVVNQLQRLAGRGIKLGHAGTLDPLASGVLLVCVGRATRLVPFLHELPKTYEAEFLLGQTSNTDDISGKVEEHPSGFEIPSRPAIDVAVAGQTGEIMQRPPAFSAIKVDGQRAYKAARQGQAVQLQERPVTVHAIEVLDYQFPRLSLRIECGSGTYIRAIGRDIGQAVGCGGLMSALTRTAIGPFRLEDAVASDQLDDDWTRHVLPAQAGFPDTPQVAADDDMIQGLRHGRPVSLDHAATRVLAVTANGELAAILDRPDQSDGLWRAIINWVPAWFEASPAGT